MNIRITFIAAAFVASLLLSPASSHAQTPNARSLVFLPLMTTGSTSQPPIQPSTPTPSVSPQAAAMLASSNARRAENGCEPLALNVHLMAAAQAHSQDMAEHQTMDHTGSDESTPWDRIAAAGYDGQAVAENLVMTAPTGEEAVAVWYDEVAPNDFHRRTLLNCEITEVGIGYALDAASTPYWTADYGKR